MISYEFSIVVWLAIILLALTAIQGALVPAIHGFKWGLGSRDETRDLTPLQGRFKRTVANHIEGMLIFVPLVVAASFADVSNETTQLAATLFFIGRLLFAPLYLFGIPVLRSAAYGLSIIGVGLYIGVLVPHLM